MDPRKVDRASSDRHTTIDERYPRLKKYYYKVNYDAKLSINQLSINQEEKIDSRPQPHPALIVLPGPGWRKKAYPTS